MHARTPRRWRTHTAARMRRGSPEPTEFPFCPSTESSAFERLSRDAAVCSPTSMRSPISVFSAAASVVVAVACSSRARSLFRKREPRPPERSSTPAISLPPWTLFSSGGDQLLRFRSATARPKESRHLAIVAKHFRIAHRLDPSEDNSCRRGRRQQKRIFPSDTCAPESWPNEDRIHLRMEVAAAFWADSLTQSQADRVSKTRSGREKAKERGKVNVKRNLIFKFELYVHMHSDSSPTHVERVLGGAPPRGAAFDSTNTSAPQPAGERRPSRARAHTSRTQINSILM